MASPLKRGRYVPDFADVNGDSGPDILAVDTSGGLWLYPNSGVASPPFAARSQIGPGWNGFQAIDVGQLTSTGPASMLAIDSAGSVWYYPNTGSGAFGARTQVGTGWSGYAIN